MLAYGQPSQKAPKCIHNQPIYVNSMQTQFNANSCQFNANSGAIDWSDHDRLVGHPLHTLFNILPMWGLGAPCSLLVFAQL